MKDLAGSLLAVDPDAAFDAVAHDQLGGPYQVPAELVRLAIAFGAARVDVQCRRGRVVVEAQGAVVPESAVESLSRASGRGDDVARLRALAALEDLDASALGWAVGLSPRRLVIRTWENGRVTTLTANGREPLRLSHDAGRREDGFFVKMTRPRLNLKRALKWLEIACRFSVVPVVVNGRNVQRDLDSGCFRARIASPLPAVIALGVELDAPRLWLLRHGVAATRIGVPNWPPFEAAVELEGRVEGKASAAQLRQAVAPHLEALIGRVADLTLRVAPRLHQLGADHRRRIISSLLRAAEKGVAVEAIRQAPLFEIVDVDGRRWVSLEALEQWPGTAPGVSDCRSVSGEVETPYLCLGAREREMVAGLIGRTLPGAVIRRSGFWTTIRGSVRPVMEFVQGLLGPRSLSDSHLTHGERELIRALVGALRVGGRPVAVTMCPGRRAPRRRERRLVLARERMDTKRAVHAVSVDPVWVYVVAVALKGPQWTVTSEVRSLWLRAHRGGFRNTGGFGADRR